MICNQWTNGEVSSPIPRFLNRIILHQSRREQLSTYLVRNTHTHTDNALGVSTIPPVETLRFLSPSSRFFVDSRNRGKGKSGCLSRVTARARLFPRRVIPRAEKLDRTHRATTFVRRVIFVRARNNKQGRIFYPPPPRDSRTSDRGFNGRVVCLPVAITRDEGPACSYIPDHFTV